MTAPEQITFDGELVPYPLPRPRRLTTRQHDLLRWVRFYNDQRGAFPTREAVLYYADAAGALRRLEAMRLVRRPARGEWWAT